MVLDEGRNVPFIPYFHEGIFFVPLSVIHYTVQVMHKASYPEVYFLDKDKKIQQYITLGKMSPVRPIRINGFLNKYCVYVWY